MSNSDFKETIETIINDTIWDENSLFQTFFDDIFDTISECNNEIAVKIFGERLDIIKTYIAKRDNDEPNYALYKMLYSLYNFELLTGIESESDGNYIGKLNPTLNDIEKWENWFQEHKDRICWYEQKNILFLKKREKAD
ncbi:MAG: hypothetical protein LBI45_02650 [Bacteroidales bacterium]|jgi:hypothetical protein|nr:hypothetical protein [Bacteroidales bacterium]